MARRRPRNVFEMGWACVECAATGRTEHLPTSADYPDTVVRRFHFTAGDELGWKISAIETPRATPAPWKIVVITGAPSWAEYWAPALAALPADREMVVVDRPGYAGSEPVEYVGDIREQARALSPLLEARKGQKVLLVGQSYGAAIATLMAEAHPKRVAGVVLLSGFFGVTGPTAKWLVGLGSRVLSVIPRDLRHAVIEVSNQAEQLDAMRHALTRLAVPVHVIHGDADDFAPIEVAEALVRETKSRRPMRFERVAGANHFMNDGPVEPLLAVLEACIPAKPAWRWPDLPKVRLPKVALPKIALPKIAWPHLTLPRSTRATVDA